MKSIKKSLIVLSIHLILYCGRAEAMPSFMDRAYSEQKEACLAGLEKKYVAAGAFTLATYQRIKAPSDSIRVYIEGDGRAWQTRNRLSDDPTPSEPVALTLATADTSDAVAYIARPGQFPEPDAAACDPTYWSARRFAPEVVDAFDKAIDKVKATAGAKHVEIIGYSGGGAIAVLVAARRADVTSLRTVAGNLDPKALCEYHKVSQLDGSMDPMSAAQKVAAIPQRHFIGSKDTKVPASIVNSFVKNEGFKGDDCITVVDGATHASGWSKDWERLLSMPLRTNTGKIIR